MATARGDDREDEYVEIFNTIQQADALDSAGKSGAATSKYEAAQIALQTFQRCNPDWNTRAVSFRIKYVGQKLAAHAEKAAAAANSASENNPAASESKTAAVGAVAARLLEPGAEPRKVLRLHPKPGDKQTMQMTIKMGMDMKMGGAAGQAMKFPPMLMAVEGTVKSVSENGEITYEFVMGDVNVADDPAVMPQVAEAIKAALGGMKGTSGTGVMSDRGVCKGIDMKMPTGVDPQLKQMMEQMNDSFSRLSVPLPEEPVGVGARWEVRAPIKSQGMTIQQITTYQVAALEGEQLTMQTTMTQTASNQKIQNPAMGGMKVDVTKMTGSGSGEVTFDLARILPSAAKVKSQMESTMAMNVGTQKQTMAMKMDMSLQFEAK